jgi:hypothetical protein
VMHQFQKDLRQRCNIGFITPLEDWAIHFQSHPSKPAPRIHLRQSVPIHRKKETDLVGRKRGIFARVCYRLAFFLYI